MAKERRHHAALNPGVRLHWYDIQSVLGQGGFGITYLAVDRNLAREVAIKEFLPTDLSMRAHDGTVMPLSTEHETSYQWGLERFIAEAKTLVQFRHPSIVQVLAVFEENNTAYMVMEYLHGETFESALRFGRVHSEANLRAIVMPLLDGVESMHEAGFIHRDIKPENIYLSVDNSPILIDFGSARQAVGVKTRTLTALVTPGYAPYEQYDSTQETDKQGPWTDVYALGATLYRAIVGHGPPDAMARVNGVLNGRDVFIALCSNPPPGYTIEFLAAIDYALAFKPEDRPRSIRAWRQCWMELPTLPVCATDRSKLDALNRAGTTEESAVGRESGTFSELETSVYESAVDDTTIEAPPPAWSSYWRTGAAFVLVGVCAWVIALSFYPRGESIAEIEVATAPIPEIPPVDSAIVNEDPLQPPSSNGDSESIEPIPIENPVDTQTVADTPVSSANAQAPTATIAESQELPVVSPVLPVESESPTFDESGSQTEAEVFDLAQSGVNAEQDSVENKVLALLALAKKDFKADRLTSPRGYNAWQKYTRVLELDNDNVAARMGLDSIGKRYVELADKAGEQRDFERAQTFLDKAEGLAVDGNVLADARQRLRSTVESPGDTQQIPPETRAGETLNSGELLTQSSQAQPRPDEFGPPYRLALVRFGSSASGGNLDSQLALEMQRSLIKRNEFIVSESYYAEGVFRDNPINKADFWIGEGNEKRPNLKGILSYSDHLDVDGLGLCWWQSGVNEDNPQLTRVTVFLVDVYHRQLYQAKGRWADIQVLIQDVTGQFMAGRLPIG